MAVLRKRRRRCRQHRGRRKEGKRRKEEVSVSVSIYICHKLEILTLNAQGQRTASKKFQNILLSPSFMEYIILITAKCLS